MRIRNREEELLTEAAQLEAETKRAAAVSACWEDDRQAVAGSGHFFPPYPGVFAVSGSFFCRIREFFCRIREFLPYPGVFFAVSGSFLPYPGVFSAGSGSFLPYSGVCWRIW